MQYNETMVDGPTTAEINFAAASAEEGVIELNHGRPVVKDGLIRIDTDDRGTLFVSVAQITKIRVRATPASTSQTPVVRFASDL